MKKKKKKDSDKIKKSRSKRRAPVVGNPEDSFSRDAAVDLPRLGKRYLFFLLLLVDMWFLFGGDSFFSWCL